MILHCPRFESVCTSPTFAVNASNLPTFFISGIDLLLIAFMRPVQVVFQGFTSATTAAVLLQFH